MEPKELMTKVDHTQLRPICTWKEIQTLCEEAIEYKMASVCVPPAYVARIKDAYGEKLVICTVIGFPLGYNTTEVKCFEAKQALEEGADELDMVINQGWVKERDYEALTEEIRQIKALTGERILKVIVETCYLNQDEKIALCQAVSEAGADFIKTSTGFGPSGATLEDVALMRAHVSPEVKIKAAGGVKTLKDMETFVQAGADRIGTSSALKMLRDEAVQTY